MTTSPQPLDEVPPAYEPPRSPEELLRRYNAGERFFPNIDIPDGSSLQGAVMADSTFKHCWLSDVDFRGADLRNCLFDCGNVKCSDFRGADLRGAVFFATAIEATWWDDANTEGANFMEATYHGSPMRDPEFPFGKFGGRA